jgi:3-oxoacyl-[acyl-carrier protein] reductase
MRHWFSRGAADMPRKIIITGASSQIGSAIAEKICKPGDAIILQCFKNKNALDSLKKTIGDACEIVVCDLSDTVQLKSFCSKLKDADVLINAAAVTKNELLVNIDEIDVEQMIKVNISALIALCKEAVRSMMMKRSGVIINISSVTASRGNRGQSVYAGTKGFVESFSRALAAEYGSRGIRINCIAPGPIDAGSLKDLLGYAEDEVKQSIAMKRLGTPNDVAALAAFLCSDGASFINGKVIGVDGGFMNGV